MLPEASKPEVPDVRSPYLLNRAACAVRKMAEDELAPFGITPRHYGILSIVAAGAPLTQQSLGEFLQIDRSTMVQLVDELEARGVVLRGKNPDDRRAHSLELTEAGRALLLESGPCMLATQERFFSPLRPDEREELERLLRKLVGDLCEPHSCPPEVKE